MSDRSAKFYYVGYSHASDDPQFPFWRVEYEVDGHKHLEPAVQANTAICALQVVCCALGVPYRPI